MFKNFLTIAYRNLIKYKSYSLINIFGLSLGIVCCILIFAYIGYEYSFDGYHQNANNIYRIVTERTLEGRIQALPSCAAPMGPTLIEEYPEVLDAVRFSPTIRRSFKYKDKRFFQTGVFYVDNSIFNVFSWELVAGDPKTALEVPYTMVLTEATAQRYFGDEDPVGKVINWDNSADYTVTGVIKAPPANSHFTFNVLASFSTFIKYKAIIGSRWSIWAFPTYLLLQEGTDIQELEQKFVDFNERYLVPVIKDSGATARSYLQPLKRIHLHSNLEGDLGTNNDIRLIRAFAAIALIILCIACINFMNLATARSASRAREVGMRKVLGAQRKKLVLQFLSESFVFALLSLLLAVFFAQLMLPYFNVLANREISINYLAMPWLSLCLLGIVIFTGIFAGSYPAFFLSAFRPISALRGDILPSAKSKMFRSLLVVSQFVISIILIISTIVIFNQQRYMKSKDLGFNKQNVLVIAVQNEMVRAKLESFKNELLNINGVISTCASSMVPGEGYLFNAGTYPEGYSREQMFRMDNFHADHDFLATFEIDIIQGRSLSKQVTSDLWDAVMINETAAKQIGWENPIGKILNIQTDIFGDSTETEPRTVIGVFKDIHQRTLYSAIPPTFIQYIRKEGVIENRARRISVRLNPEGVAETLTKIEQKWHEVYPDIPYYTFFLDEFYENLHAAEEKLGNIFRTFALIAILVACLGLLGLAAFTAERRTKEIGIRKVFGSSVSSIVILLCRDFIRLILIANVIAWPVAFYAMNKWLQNFPYPITLGISTFLITALLTLLVALITVGYQSFRAARANPIDSLRYE